MRGLFIGLIVFLLIISGCVDGKYIGRKVDSSLNNEDNSLTLCKVSLKEFLS